jgi:geranylgeranyl diphosphate synthase, type III
MSSQKGLCEDLTEGKFSFPVIHAVRFDQTNRVLINILKMKPTDEAVKHYAVDYMQRVGSFDYTRKVLEELSSKASGLAKDVEANVAQTDSKAAATGMAGMKLILSKLSVNG